MTSFSDPPSRPQAGWKVKLAALLRRVGLGGLANKLEK
jgi:hypothetical protein